MRYEKPLGAPTGPGVKDAASGVWTRTFKGAKGTTIVTFDAKTNDGKIAWADSDGN